MDYETMMREIARLENDFPALSAEILASSVLGRRIPCLSFGRGKRAVVYLGAHHGMEHPTSEIRSIRSASANAVIFLIIFIIMQSFLGFLILYTIFLALSIPYYPII